MSTAPRNSWNPSRATGSLQDGKRRARAGSRVARQNTVVTRDDAYSFALRVAYLHYLLQPKKKRKEYIAAPKPAPRQHTSAINELMKDFTPTGTTTPSTKLPHGFRPLLEKRIEGILRGSERLPGFNDADFKRTIAEAYTQFTKETFRKSIDIDRKVEPLVLIFYASATKAQSRGKAPDDHGWKGLPDRHTALFIRLINSILKDNGSDRDKPELVRGLTTLENKLLTNDQNLYIDTGQDAGHTIEVEVPLTYEVKDMAMVQIVLKIFGTTSSHAQADIEAHRSSWTEEAALKDLKQYQHRLNSNMAGALRRQDFDLDEAFEEWKKTETPLLSQMMLEVLTARPELAKASSGGYEKPLPVRPTSMYGEDQAYSDLSKMVTSPVDGNTSFGFDPSASFGGLSMDDSPSIRQVPDEASYTFIPADPRAVYLAVSGYAFSYDQINGDPELAYTPMSKQTNDLLMELAVWWRLPQFSRHVLFLDAAARKFLDHQMSVKELNSCFEFVKGPGLELKKAPHIQLIGLPLSAIDTSKWTMADFAIYQQTLSSLNDALLRELYDLLQHCYEPKPPSIAMVMMLIMNHIYEDGVFSPREEDQAAFTQLLTDGLRQRAAQVYREYLDEHVPRSQEDWDFSHVVGLGKDVVNLCDRIRKRYRKNPEIMGVNPFVVLVETMFPNFEADAHDLIQRILQVAQDRGLEVNIQDGFDMYHELVEIRKIHVENLPGKPFAFHVEGLLDVFVWRWIRTAETRMEEFVDSAIREDQFKIKSATNPGHVPTDGERHSHSVLDLFALFNQTLDQVFELNWDDDVHHAKFMTALAKAYTTGIGRYCEIVEQRFAKEMDRPTAQEVALAGKTTQERFLQYAKDAWNNKEKIEPFQFYPESFVKLNNIEYAMQALDKLEKRMNVDQCYEVLRQAEPQQEKQSRKSTKNVFTIKICEAEDLKACDPTGTSDPYVVLNDEFGRRLAKTRIVMRNLNPRWDESVDISVQGPLNIVATIWDYDTFGDHDFVGRTSLKLDPLHFSDYLPREYWLDLDTQGRLLLRVSMEGERDDIQFYFGKSFRHLKRTERDMVRKITDKLRAHINASLSQDALRTLLSRGLAASMANLWKKRTSTLPALTPADVENALQNLFDYFNENFAIMKETLTDATMLAVMTRLWKEVLMAIENLVVPPVSEKPSLQKPLTQTELDVVYKWLQLLFDFFHARDDHGEVLGVPADILKSPKWHELASLNFFYFDTTDNLIRISERMAAATAQRAQQQLQNASSPYANNRLSAPASLGPSFGAGVGAAAAFASMGTIRRGKSIMMSRNLGTMRRAKEEKRKEAQADPSDDMILRILRMRPEAAGYLKERHRQKERMAASQAAAMILRQSLSAGWSPGGSPGGAFGRNNLPRR